MKRYSIVFSPTGGTEKVVCALTEKWGEVEQIDLSDPSDDHAGVFLEGDDIAVIAMPSFGGVAPQLVLDRLLKIKGNGCRCSIVAVYGNRAYENTLVQMEDYAVEAGFRVIAAVSAVAEHSILHRFAAGRPDGEDCNELARFGEKIIGKAMKGDVAKPKVPGERPYKQSGALMIPKATSACHVCGVCISKCPAGASSADDPKKTDRNKCISCMRCVSICPSHARKVSGFMTAVAEAKLKKACSGRKENELFL